MKKPIQIGVVGCGYWGPNLVRNLRSLPECRIKMICDQRAGRLESLRRLYPEIEGETDFEHMLNGAQLDAVFVATPVEKHHEMVKGALLAGKHVFVEKPLAASGSECEELVELADRQGLILMVGHTFLYSPPVRKMKEIMDEGDIGHTLYISSRRLNLGLYQKTINVVWDLAPHDLSIITYLMGEQPVSVNCRGSANITRGIEDVSNMTLSFASGGYAAIHSSWLDPRKVREMTVVGSRRMIVYDDCEPLGKIKIYDARVETPPHYDTFAEFQYSYHYGDVYVPYIQQEEPLKVECRHFLDCVYRDEEPLTSGRDGLALVRILEAACESMKDNGTHVQLSPALYSGPVSRTDPVAL